MAQTKVGELLILGFKGPRVPEWLISFEREFGLGGVILFDYDLATRTYRNNVESKDQVAALCAELHALPSRPLLYVDQEGGKVRRLKESLGFAPLPSQEALSQLAESEALSLLRTSFRELKELGIHFNLAPVIDINSNPENPDIGKVARSYSPRLEEVRRCALLAFQAAREAGIGLCLKHYPGLGGATVNSHLELTDLTGKVPPGQMELFDELLPQVPGSAVLLSHGTIREWNPELPISVLPKAVSLIRKHSSDALLLTDDLQMEGLQRLLNTPQAVLAGLEAGVDVYCIGNNLKDEQASMAALAREITQAAARDPKIASNIEASIARVQERKRAFGSA